MQFLRRFKIGARLYMMSMAFLLPLAILFYLYFNSATSAMRFAQREKAGIAYLHPLMELLQAVPKYQLAVLADPKGDACRAATACIDGALRQLRAVDARYHSLCFPAPHDAMPPHLCAHPDEIEVQCRWAMDGAGRYPDEAARRAYLTVLDELQTLIRHVADSSGLTLDSDLDSYYLMDIVVFALPQAQARLGATLVDGRETLVTPERTEDERVPYIILAEQLKDDALDRIVRGALPNIMDHDALFYGKSESLQANLPGAVQAYSRALEDFIALLKRLGRSCPPMPPEDSDFPEPMGPPPGPPSGIASTCAGEFLTVGGMAGKAGMTLWNVAIDELETLLDIRAEHYRGERRLGLILTFAAVAISLALVALISRSITGPLRRTRETMMAAAQGDLKHRCCIMGADELGEMGRACNTLIDNLKSLLDGIFDTSPFANRTGGRFVEIAVHVKASFTRGASVSGRGARAKVMEPVGQANAADLLVVQDRELRYVQVMNPPFAGDVEDMIGKTDYDFYEKVDADRLVAIKRRILETGRSEHVDIHLVDPTGLQEYYTGTYVPKADSTGRIDGIMGYFRNITEQTRMDKALRESEARFRSLIANLPDLLVSYDMEYRCRFVSESVREYTDANPADLIGKHHRETGLTPDVADAIEQAFNQAAATGAVQDIAFAAPLRGEKAFFETRIYPEYDAARCLVGMVTITRNVTEQSRLEERLRQSEKMDAVGQLAGGIAHDFNNQLSGIIGFSDLLSKRLEDPKLRHYAESILTASRRAAHLTSQLLAFSRKGKFLSVPVDVHGVIAEAVALLKRSIDKRIEVRERLEAEPSLIRGDPSQMQSALLNLAINARDAMPDGGEILFSTRITRLEKKAFDFDIPAGNYLEVSITDNGTGMSAEVKRHLFEPFFTTKEQGKGTGLGLASVFGTVKSHKGAVTVYSEQGRGTTFKLYLPLMEEHHVAPELPAGTEPRARRGARILVIDDEPVICDSAVEMLRDLGYEAEAYCDPQKALDYYRTAASAIDLVILDMVMPKMTGRQLFAAMKAINPQIRALLSSGYSLNGEAQRILDEGVLEFIYKPYQQSDLARLVDGVLERG